MKFPTLEAMSKRNKEVDDVLRKKLAKLRFRRLVRIAFANFQWITDADDQGITLNVKKNVAMLVRKKHKTGILTMAQKGLLATRHRTRTIPERKKLCTIVAGLGCFTQIPPKIRARLVPYLHFMVVGAGRTLMKEGDIPTGVYFMVSGEVEMSRNIYNKITRKMESKPEAFFGPGDWIGEVELLEENVRMNTYRATSNCEILALDDVDFRALLMPYVKKVWIEKKRAIFTLSYLKYMSETQIVSACKFGILRQYNPLDTIFPEEKDSIHHVHFVLSGECVILQCLHMKVSNLKGEVRYELPDVVNVESDSDADAEERAEPFDVTELLRSSSSLDEAGYNKKKQKRRAEFAKIEANCKLLNQKPEPVEELPQRARKTRATIRQLRQSIVTQPELDFDDYFDAEDYGDDYDEYSSDDAPEASLSPSLTKESINQSVRTTSKIGKLSKLSRHHEPGSRGSDPISSPSLSSNSTVADLAKPIKDGNYATHFVDVGSMYFGGLFGVGERADHRVIMARSTVQCLLIPQYWLMEEDQNPGHMWQRMRFYLDRCIPSRATLFQDFIKTRKWAKFMDNCVEPFTHSVTNPTKIEDIPTIIRIIESKQSHE